MPTTAKAKPAEKAKVDLPADPAEFAQKSVDQAQAAFEKANDLAHDNVQVFDAAANAFKANASELQMKVTEFAQANVNSAFAFTRAVLTTAQPIEVLELQKSFVEDQMKAMTRQLTEINTISIRLAEETTKPVHNGVLKSFEEARKAFVA